MSESTLELTVTVWIQGSLEYGSPCHMFAENDQLSRDLARIQDLGAVTKEKEALACRSMDVELS